MSPNIIAVVVGIGLFLLGMKIASRSQSGDRVAINQGLSVFGSIKQSIENVRMTAQGKHQTQPHDWIGWSLSILGLVVGVWGFLKP